MRRDRIPTERSRAIAAIDEAVRAAIAVLKANSQQSYLFNDVGT